MGIFFFVVFVLYLILCFRCCNTSLCNVNLCEAPRKHMCFEHLNNVIVIQIKDKLTKYVANNVDRIKF